MAKVEDALAEAGIDSNSTTWSVLDPWLTWYAFSLAETEPEAWPALAPLSNALGIGVTTSDAGTIGDGSIGIGSGSGGVGTTSSSGGRLWHATVRISSARNRMWPPP